MVRRAILQGTSCYTQKVQANSVALSYPSFTFVSHTIPLIALKNGGYARVKKYIASKRDMGIHIKNNKEVLDNKTSLENKTKDQAFKMIWDLIRWLW